ncbi:MAG: glycoside hydrolase family 5 protein [Ruminococcus sp.]|nr:glycoside hydrolase family 5 protein [Ruminococcus sp.]
MELVQDMGAGINLGNTFESCGSWIQSNSVTNYETGWGSPVITKEMIQGYADEGFGVLRVPVAWSNMMQDNYTIHPDYMARVKEVVTWAIDADLYVILNIHWDGGWWEAFPTDKDTCMTKYKRIWEQICAEFKDFDESLMFESLNEEGCWDSVWNRWGGENGKDKAYGLLNEINQTFVDLVRASGGNNADRHLLIAGYATDIELTCDAMFKMPADPKNRCAVSVHYYTPSTFCILTEDADWGKAKTDWGSDSDRAELDKYMTKMKTTFVDKGIPVIIGEYGVAQENKDPAVVRDFVTSVAQAAYEKNLCPVLWDTTGSFYDRSACKMKDAELMQGLLPKN